MQIGSDKDMKELGVRIGRALRGGECIELRGDVGAGKTTFVKGLASGLLIAEDVQSPSFTISHEYQARDGLRLAHYDFYRLNEAGVMSYELAESLADPLTITAIEWGETIDAILPSEHIVIDIAYRANDTMRDVEVRIPSSYNYIKEET